MSESDSSPQNTTQTSTNVKTDNLNASGNTGPTNVGGGSLSTSSNTAIAVNSDSHNLTTTDSHNVTNVTDFGAVSAGANLGHDAIDASTGLATQALSTAESLATSSDVFAGQTVATYTGAISDFADKFTTALTSLAGQQQTQLGNTTASLAEIAREQSESGDQQVIDAVTATQASLQQIVKYVAIAAVAGILLYAIAKKG